MGYYSVGGLGQGNGSANEALCALWNPSSTVNLWVIEIGVNCAQSVTTDFWQVSRTTTRGTPASTVTPDLDNAWDRDIAPPSGALLDLSQWSAEPTKDASVLYAHVRGGTSNPVGSGFDKFFLPHTLSRGIMVPPGTGLAVWGRDEDLDAASVYYSWWEKQ